MIRRIRIHGFRCLENFDLALDGLHSALLIGKNGSGKTAVRQALEVLRRIGQGTNRIGELIQPASLTRGRSVSLLRFEIEANVEERTYCYSLALELPKSFKELRVLEEKLEVDGGPVYSRSLADVEVERNSRKVSFSIDWHLVALPIVQERDSSDPLAVFKRWLRQWIILSPIPELISGDSKAETLEPGVDASNFGAWFAGLLAYSPAAYGKIDNYLREMLPDFSEAQNPLVGQDARSLAVAFRANGATLHVPFRDLSTGEKCMFIGALVLASRSVFPDLFCFWDEPDNFLAMSEVSPFITALRSGFDSGGQFIATSHHAEVIRRFSDENTFVLERASHLEPPTVRSLRDVSMPGDLVTRLLTGYAA